MFNSYRAYIVQGGIILPELKRIVILGAGYAGIEAAKVLNKQFKKDDKVEITLINDNPFQTLTNTLYTIINGQVVYKKNSSSNKKRGD